jgi:hypothetical protein
VLSQQDTWHYAVEAEDDEAVECAEAELSLKGPLSLSSLLSREGCYTLDNMLSYNNTMHAPDGEAESGGPGTQQTQLSASGNTSDGEAESEGPGTQQTQLSASGTTSDKLKADEDASPGVLEACMLLMSNSTQPAAAAAATAAADDDDDDLTRSIPDEDFTFCASPRGLPCFPYISVSLSCTKTELKVVSSFSYPSEACAHNSMFVFNLWKIRL